MTSAITLNAILSAAVFLLIVTPIILAVRKHHRHELVTIARERRNRQSPAYVRARGRYRPTA